MSSVGNSWDDFLVEILEDVSIGGTEEDARIRQIIHEIRTCICESRNKSFTINRTKYSGSFEKGTAIKYKFDIDVIFFINCGSYEDYMAQRGDYLKEIEEILLDEYDEDLEIESNSFSLEFTIDNIEIDLLVAMNAAKPPYRDSVIIDQYENILNVIHAPNYLDEKPYEVAFNLGTSVSEYATHFVKNQEPFTLDLIILCKLWNYKYLVLNDIRFSGQSSTIELMAISVAKKLRRRKSLSRAFQIFLEICENIEKVDIDFKSDYWFPFDSQYLDVPPRILDPVNPYNNRVKKMKKEIPEGNVTILEQVADTASWSLKNYEKCFKRKQFRRFFLVPEKRNELEMRSNNVQSSTVNIDDGVLQIISKFENNFSF